MKTHEDALKPNNSNTEEDQEAVTQAFDEEAKKKGLTFTKLSAPDHKRSGVDLIFHDYTDAFF